MWWQICYLRQFIMQYFIYLVTAEMCLVKKTNTKAHTHTQIHMYTCISVQYPIYTLVCGSMPYVREDVTQSMANMWRLVSYLCRLPNIYTITHTDTLTWACFLAYLANTQILFWQICRKRKKKIMWHDFLALTTKHDREI